MYDESQPPHSISGWEKLQHDDWQKLTTPEVTRRGISNWTERARARVEEREIEEPSLISLIVSRLRKHKSTFASPGKAIGAILTHLGQKAFVWLAAFAGLMAIVVQVVAARMRALNSSKSPRVQDLMAAVSRRTGALQKRFRYSSIAGRVFDEKDVDGSGEIDKTELYCLVLQIYTTVPLFTRSMHTFYPHVLFSPAVQVTNYFPSCLYPPSKVR